MTNQNKNFKFFLIFYILAYFKPYRFQNESLGFLNFVQLQFVLRRFEVLRQLLCVMQYRASLTATDELGNVESAFNVGGKLDTTSNKDVKVVGSEVGATEIDIKAKGDVNILAGYNTSFSESKTVKSGLFSGGSLYSKQLDIEGKGDKTAVGSKVSAKTISIKTGEDIVFEGAEVVADKMKTDSGKDTIVTAAEEEHYSYSVHEKTTVGLGDFAKSISRPDKMVTLKDGRASVKLSEAKYDKTKEKNSQTTQKGSDLKIGEEGWDAVSEKNIVIKGSDVASTGDITLDAKENVEITYAEEKTKSQKEEIHGKAELSVGVSHQASNVYNAAKSLKETTKKLKETKEAYSKYKDDLSTAKSNYKKGLISKEDYDDMKEDEAFYIASIGMLASSVEAKTLKLNQEVVGLSKTNGTLGFTGDVTLDVDALIQKTESEIVKAKGSNLSAKNITIKAGKTASITGSDINASEDIGIEAEDVAIAAARNSSSSSNETQYANYQFKYSTASEATQDFSFDMSQNKNKNASYANSHIGGKNITIKSTKDTTIEGGVVKATENVNLDVGGDLKVVSLQDTSKSKSMSLGVNFSYSKVEEKDSSSQSISGGINAGISRGDSKWVNEKSSISGGGNVNIYVANKTTLKGADIYSKTDKLSLDTGDLGYSDIRDKNKMIGLNGGISAHSSTGANAGSSSNYNVKADLQNKTQVNKSTIGQGTITVRNDSDKDLSDLNRDMANAQIKVKDTDVTIEADKASVNALLNPIDTAKEIKHEGQRIGDRVETVVEGVKKALDENDNDSALDYVGQSFARQNAATDFVKKHPDVAKILTDPNASPEEQQAARNLQAQYIAKELNIPYAQVKLYLSENKDKVAGNSAGMDPKDKNDHNVFLNKAEDSNDKSDSYILNHEISHEKDKADGIIRGEDFANLMGSKGDDALSKELSYAGLGTEATTTDEWRENNFNSTLLNTNTKLAESYSYDEVDQKVLEYLDTNYLKAKKQNDTETMKQLEEHYTNLERDYLKAISTTSLLVATKVAPTLNGKIIAGSVFLASNSIELIFYNDEPPKKLYEKAAKEVLKSSIKIPNPILDEIKNQSIDAYDYE